MNVSTYGNYIFSELNGTTDEEHNEEYNDCVKMKNMYEESQF